MSAMRIFPTAVSNYYAFDSGRYVKKDTLEVGKGYWVKFDRRQTVTVGGLPVIAPVPVKKGWNIIGPYDFPVDLSLITTEPPNILVSSFFGYADTTGYYRASVLLPGKGY